MVPMPWCVQRFWWETDDTFSFEMEPQNRAPTFRFHPGQSNMLYAFSVGEVPISISGDSAKAETLIHAVRALDNSCHQCLKPGAQLGLRGPFGCFCARDRAREIDPTNHVLTWQKSSMQGNLRGPPFAGCHETATEDRVFSGQRRAPPLRQRVSTRRRLRNLLLARGTCKPLPEIHRAVRQAG
jgi:hypothetical protein